MASDNRLDPVFLDDEGHPLLRFRLGGPEVGSLVVGSTGWCFWEFESLDIRVRLEWADRVQITGVALLSSGDGLFGPSAVSVTELREIPLVRLDATLNDPRRSGGVVAALEWARDHGQDLSPTSSVERLAIEHGPAVPPLPQDYALEGVGERSRPDSFYASVAAAWATALANGHRNPANLIADANGVNATAVHRWVREARRRGEMARSSRQVEAFPSETDQPTTH